MSELRRTREWVRDRMPLRLWHYLRGGRPRLHEPRKFLGYGVGLGKTGTTSLARIFESRHRAAKEPGAAFLVSAIERRMDGRASRGELERFLQRRDQVLDLEFESNQLLGLLTDILVDLFPDARFVLTVRDCFSWLESEIGQQLGHLAAGSPGPWQRWWKFAFGFGESHSYAAEEHALRDLGLPPLALYFAHWTRHNEAVLASVPADRLLVIRTSEIRARLDDIATFVGVTADTLDAGSAHSHARPRKPLRLLDTIGPAFLDQSAARNCGPLMRCLFPEISGSEDALPS